MARAGVGGGGGASLLSTVCFTHSLVTPQHHAMLGNVAVPFLCGRARSAQTELAAAGPTAGEASHSLCPLWRSMLLSGRRGMSGSRRVPLGALGDGRELEMGAITGDEEKLPGAELRSRQCLKTTHRMLDLLTLL